MKSRKIIGVLSIPVFMLSCTHMRTQDTGSAEPVSQDGQLLQSLKQEEHRELLKAASQRLENVRDLIEEGELNAAEAALRPLIGEGIFEEEVAHLLAVIEEEREDIALEIAKQKSAHAALTAVEQRLILPGKYGSTVVIDGEQGPLEIPIGPMEELFQRRVDINVQNAGVKELVQALTQIEGLNIIADEALEAENALTINVRNAPLGEILSYIARNMGVAFHVGENIVWVTESEEPPGTGPKLETQIYRLRKGFIPTLQSGGGGAFEGGGRGGGGGGGAQEDNELEDALAAVLSDSPQDASYRIFKTRNLLLVRDTRENLRVVEELLEHFDRPPYQVLIEAVFLTIGQDDLRDVGVEISQTNVLEDLDPDDPEQLRETTLETLFGAPEGNLGSLTLSGVLADRTYDIVLRAIEETSSARTLSAPRVTVLNNHTARIRRGDKILYYDELETVAASGGGDGGSAVAETAFTGSPKELELGVTLEVKVNVGNDGETVLLGLMPEVIELKRWRTFNVVADGGGTGDGDNGDDTDGEAQGDLELPETTESVVTTNVSIKSGETVVLGGLISSNAQIDIKKVPVLGDIPVLGWLFRRETESDVPQHLLIFVTAKVINESGQFVRVGIDEDNL